MTTKRILRPDRVRRPPEEGFSWVDRRFLRDHAPELSSEAVLLYFFLCAVSDQHGLSYWGDDSTAARLHLPGDAVARARSELVAGRLVAYERPLYQVLSLPVRDAELLPRGGEPGTVASILGELGARWAAERSS